MKNRIFKLLLHPNIVLSRLSWHFEKAHLLSVGKKISLGQFFELKGNEFISIGDNVVSRKFLKLHVWNEYKDKKTEEKPSLKIGSHASFGDNCYVSCANNISIGDNVLIGDNVFITDNFHGRSSLEELEIPPADRELWIKGPVKIESNVWLGRNVCVMPGVTIGYGAVIGANSVVTKDIPDRSVAAGSPAVVIRRLE